MSVAKEIDPVDPSTIAALAEEIGLAIVDRAELQDRSARFAPAPGTLARSVRSELESSFRKGLYSHQAAGIAAALEGHDLCVATSTASGKSLVFMSVAAHALCLDGQARVLVLYPARALIQDQIEKWRGLLDRLALRVGLIDGGVPVSERAGVLESSHVVLMTPDVAHAWLLARLGEREIGRFLERFRLLVLDETHVYDGVFGTNMAYFLRRLDAAARARFRLIATTATLGRPGEFVQRLTGRVVTTIGPNDDGSPAPRRTILLANAIDPRSFQLKATLLKEIAQRGYGRFLAFGDSRRMVERLVVTAQRRDTDGTDAADGPADEETAAGPAVVPGELLPYRAGYETEDRNEIQRALTQGSLAGVVSTSALELGLDIGDIDVVVLLNPPTSTKAFWQRIGRTGRTRPGVCVLIDDSGIILDRDVTLASYLAREIEPNWLYLDNRYIQYTNALCAAQELRGSGNTGAPLQAFGSLPEKYRSLVENELNQTEVVPDDLYPLKQRAQAGPHHEFPLRSGIEQSFQVSGPFSRPLGTLTYGQMLREGYPGAVYYYMARPYRIAGLNYRQGEIIAKREKYLTTKPIAQTMVFPRFTGGILNLRLGRDAFVAEAELQVSERVIGFKEIRGNVDEEHLYGPGSPHARRDLTRFFPTTGVCWYFPEKRWVSERLGTMILEAYSGAFGVQSRDVGVGMFHAKASPLGNEKCQGMCVFDATHGSLRLTQRLAESFPEVLETAFALATARRDLNLAAELQSMQQAVLQLERATVLQPGRPVDAQSASPDEWVILIAEGSVGMLESDTGAQEVRIRGYRYTPRGLLYDLEPAQPGLTVWQVAARDVRSIYGQSQLIQVNLVTGAVRPAGE